ncbi:MAG: hypothetical protein J6K62_02825 [Clostridia bacterium]|nr:hypothetical protein [Clostridia bacterium]
MKYNTNLVIAVGTPPHSQCYYSAFPKNNQEEKTRFGKNDKALTKTGSLPYNKVYLY